jgi:hypothetical protein
MSWVRFDESHSPRRNVNVTGQVQLPNTIGRGEFELSSQPPRTFRPCFFPARLSQFANLPLIEHGPG